MPAFPTRLPRRIPLKVIVAGGFGAGKTTFVASMSDIEPLTTEASTTVVGRASDGDRRALLKPTTTVALDFGRAALGPELALYLYGAPGQDRFGFMWDELLRGAVGAVVLVDSGRLAASFPIIDHVEQRGTPFVVAINAFDGRVSHDRVAVRRALRLSNDVPVVVADARDRGQVRKTLVEVVRRALAVAGENGRAHLPANCSTSG